MLIRRIFAGAIVVLLLSVSTLAAACDLSCAFAAMSSDCHAERTAAQDSGPDGMNMNGMSMAGMTMPEIGNSPDQQTVSAVSRTTAGHPSIGEMGPCERQACDNDSTVSVKASRSVAPQLHSILAAAETPRAVIAPSYFHDARDDISHYRPLDGSSFLLSLRI
jgi:hypothetical protein